MRILVTGGCGFVGSNLIRHVLGHYGPAMVSNVDRLTYAGNLANTADLAGRFGERYEFYRADIANRAQMAALFAEHRFFAVVNCAAETQVDRSIADPAPFVRANVTGTEVLLDCVRRHGVKRFVQLSTDEVYGSLADDRRFTEDAPLNPASPYAASKAAADHLALAFGKSYGREVVVARAAHNYGPYQHPEKLIPKAVVNALRDRPVPVFGDGGNRRDWLHVEDLCTALVALLLDGRPGEIYNVGGDGERRNIDVVHAILERLGKPRDLVEFVADRPAHDPRCAVDAGKIRDGLGWKPLWDFERGLAATVAWYAANRRWWEPLLAAA